MIVSLKFFSWIISRVTIRKNISGTTAKTEALLSALVSTVPPTSIP